MNQGQEASPSSTIQDNSKNQSNSGVPMIATFNFGSLHPLNQAGRFREDHNFQNLQSQFQQRNDNQPQLPQAHFHSSGLEFQQERHDFHVQNDDLLENNTIYATANFEYGEPGMVGCLPSRNMCVTNEYDQQSFSRAVGNELPTQGISNYCLNNLKADTLALISSSGLSACQQPFSFEDGSVPSNDRANREFQFALQYNQQQMRHDPNLTSNQMIQYPPEQVLRMQNVNYEVGDVVSNDSSGAAAQYDPTYMIVSNGSDVANASMMAQQMETLARTQLTEHSYDINQRQNFGFSQKSLRSLSRLTNDKQEGNPGDTQDKIFARMLRSQHEMLRQQKFGGPVMANFSSQLHLQPGAFLGQAATAPDFAMAGYASLFGDVNGANIRQPVKKKKSKPKDKPKRPLSAYNLFFQAERAFMLSQIPSKINGNDGTIYSEDQIDLTNGNIDSSRKRKRMPKHGKLGFEDMAKTIASKWKTIDPERKIRYQEEASLDKERYKLEIEQYHFKQQQNESTLQDQRNDSELKQDVIKVPLHHF